MLKVSLLGPVEIRDELNQPLPLVGSKARGLVALLMLSNDYSRSRNWIREKLWSDRGYEQGAASLRQTIRELRKALGVHQDVLITNTSGLLKLDPKKITLVHPPEFAPDDLCSDLNIRDKEFMRWLEQQRLSISNMLTLTPISQNLEQRSLIVITQREDLYEADWAHNTLMDSLNKTILETCDISVADFSRSPRSLIKPNSNVLLLRLAIMILERNFSVSARLETMDGNRIFWQSPTIEINRTYSDRDLWKLRSLAQMAAGSVLDAFESSGANYGSQSIAAALGNRARRLLFSLGRSDLAEADRLFGAAHALDPKGVYLSWRGFVRNTARFEYLNSNFLEPYDESELHSMAIKDDPQNSYALIFAAQHSFVNEKQSRFGEKSMPEGDRT